MLIAACGAGGTGKTTTMRALSAATGIPFIPSASRTVFARRGLKETDQNHMTPQEQWDLQQEIFAAREELEARLGHEGIADRTLFDQVAYNLLRAPTLVTEAILNDLANRAWNVTAKYKKVFYFPLTTYETSDDGMRDMAYGLRFSFDAILRSLLRGQAHVEMPMGTIEERVQFILGEI